MMAYISVTRVKQMITEVMAPVMQSARKESAFVRTMDMKMNDLESQTKGLKADISNV